MNRKSTEHDVARYFYNYQKALNSARASTDPMTDIVEAQNKLIAKMLSTGLPKEKVQELLATVGVDYQYEA